MPKAKSVEQRSRPPLARMMRIHEKLQEEEFPNCSSLAKEIEVATKTINRDIDFMRSQLGLPIEWDATENGYTYSEPVDAFPTVQVSEGELFALLVAQKSLEAYAGTPFEQPLENAFRKISEGLKDKIFISLDRMDASVSFRTAGISNADLETFQLVTRAVAQEQSMTFEYKGFSDRAFRRRHVQPWHICCVDGQWYVIGYDHLRKAKRTFLLVRMRMVALTGEPFRRPKDFNIHDHLKDSFGIFVGSELQRVRIEFKGNAARLIQEKTWHPTQTVKELPNGRVEFAVKLGDLWEIERWVLGWGGEAKVLSPAKLRNRVRKQAEAILKV